MMGAWGPKCPFMWPLNPCVSLILFNPQPIGSMYGIYANIWGILMGSMLPYIAYMDPMGNKNTYLGYRYWLVVWNIVYFPFHTWDVILPIDELILFRGVQTTNQIS